MNEIRYRVYLDGDLVAENMRLDHAIILCQALFGEYEQQAYCCGLRVTLAANKVSEVSVDE